MINMMIVVTKSGQRHVFGGKDTVLFEKAVENLEKFRKDLNTYERFVMFSDKERASLINLEAIETITLGYSDEI